jgi:hypothetical protein
MSRNLVDGFESVLGYRPSGLVGCERVRYGRSRGDR